MSGKSGGVNRASYTPGPWKVVGDEFCEPWKTDVCTERDNECVLVASVRIAPPVGETGANADLIAAAPDLLEALKAIESCLSPYDNDYAAQKVRAAIAKAEGR